MTTVINSDVAEAMKLALFGEAALHEALSEAPVANKDIIELGPEELNEMVAIEMQAEMAEEEAAAIAKAQAEDEADEIADEADEDEANLTFGMLIESVSEAETKDMMASTVIQFDTRADFERAKNPSNGNMQKTLIKNRQLFQGPLVAACMVALDVNPRFINASERTGARRNVYGIEKIGDLLRSIATGRIKNEVNIAMIRSMVAMEKAGLAFASKHALAATSDKMPVEGDAAKVMAGHRHTVSANTASTQTSSTMTALQAIGAVRNVGTDHAQVFEFTNAPVVARLKEVFAK